VKDKDKLRLLDLAFAENPPADPEIREFYAQVREAAIQKLGIKDPLTVEAINEMVDEMEEHKNDKERADSILLEIFYQTLAAISDEDCLNPAALAQAALKANDIETSW
jgi:hypothetical protein